MKRLLPLPVLLLLSYWSIRPLFSPGFFPMHDDTQPTRVQQMTRSLSDGQFPVRWVADLGYGFGYPIFNFYAPMPYYIGAMAMFAGFDALAAAKIMMGIGMVVAAISMFFLAGRLAGTAAGIVSAVLYLYAPYHAVNLYVRGAVGELWAYGFLPLVILGIYESINGNGKRGLLIGSIGLTAVLLSHNILGMITLMVFIFGLFVYAVGYLLSLRGGTTKEGTVRYPPKQSLLIRIATLSGFTRNDRGHNSAVFSLVFILLLGVGLSAFFTVPAFLEKGYTRVEELTRGGSDFQQHFVYPDQLWDSPWGYAGSAPGRADGMSFKIGKLHLFLGLISYGILLLFYKRRKTLKKSLVIGHWSLVVLSISIFLMLPDSQFLWDSIWGFAYIQYPWRFLNLALLCLSVLASLAVSPGMGKWKWFVTLGIIVLAMTVNAKYFIPSKLDDRQAGDYTDEKKIRYEISKISDEYMPPDFVPPESPEEAARQQTVTADALLKYDTLGNMVTEKEYRLFMQEDGTVIFPVAYFPRWQGTVDDIAVPVTSQDGRITLSLSQGEHHVVLMQRSTAIEHAGNTISLLSLFLLGYVSLSGTILLTWGRNHPLRS